MPRVKFRFERFMALRYLWGAEGREEGRTFLRFITYVAIGGVALGVAALLLALSIVRGFSNEIEEKIMGLGAHVQVQGYAQGTPLENASSLRSALADMEGVERVMPVVEQPVLLRHTDDAIDGVMMLGVREAPPYLQDRIVEGTFELEGDQQDKPGLVVGKELATQLGLELGDLVTTFALREGSEGSATLRPPRVRQFVVRGMYDTSLQNIDDVFVFASLPEARGLAGLSAGSVSRFNVSVHDTASIDSLAADIERQFGFPVSARTIYQQYAGLFAWVNLQENIIPLVIGVIVIVAAFNIIGTLLMMIVEKTREIGVLQSLGTSARSLNRLFLVLGLLIGVVGTGIGATLALGLGLLQQQFELIPLPAEAYYMTTAPIALNPLDFVVVSLVTLALCAGASYIPARVAARVEPVRAIRFQ